MTNIGHLDHWLTAPLISSQLILSQLLFRTCFRWSISMIFSQYTTC